MEKVSKFYFQLCNFVTHIFFATAIPWWVHLRLEHYPKLYKTDRIDGERKNVRKTENIIELIA